MAEDGPRLETVMDVFVTFAGIELRIALPPDPGAAEIIQQNFAGFERPALERAQARIDLEIGQRDGRFTVRGPHGDLSDDLELADLLFEIEGIIVPAAQVLRADLVFVHAGVVGNADRLLLMVGESGAGKSTLSWALTERGFEYWSDELAPLEIESGPVRVYPYPHAICLKQDRSELCRWPEGTFDVGPTRHIPVSALAAGTSHDARAVTDVLFVSHQSNQTPELAPISASETAFRLYPQILNALAHPDKGLSVAKSIAQRVNGYRLRSSDLDATCTLIEDSLGL